MNVIARMREGVKSFYASYDVYIRPVLKFGLAVLIFIAINDQLGYLSALNNLFVILILAVICAILPLNGIVVIGTVLIVAHCFGLGLEVGGFALILYIVMALLYFRFVPKDAIILLLAPVAFRLELPLLIPLTAGLLCGPVSAISVVCGLISWQFIHVVSTSIEPMKSSATTSLLDVLQTMPQELVSRDIILLMITFVVIMLVVTVIRKLLSSHSWEIAIFVGSALYVFLMITGGGILETEVETSSLVFGTVVSAVAALVLEFFFYNADYSGSEYLQFEDDRYYYHVKVVPKILPDLPREYDEPDDRDYEDRSRSRRRRSSDRRDERDRREYEDERRYRDDWQENSYEDSRGRRSAEEDDGQEGSTRVLPEPDVRQQEGSTRVLPGAEIGYQEESDAELLSDEEAQIPSGGAAAAFGNTDGVPTDATIPYEPHLEGAVTADPVTDDTKIL